MRASGATSLLPAVSVVAEGGGCQGVSEKSPANGALLWQMAVIRDM
jgi:hypothetical protein